MKILVTGSSGLIGSALKKILNNVDDEYIYLTSKDGDLTCEEVVKSLFAKYNPDVVIHLAANVGGLFKNMYQRAVMFEDNALMNTMILKYCRIHAVSKVIVILSTCVFPDGIEELYENALHHGPPHSSNEGYAYSKRIMEVHSRILFQEHGINTICLTPTNIYGPNDNFNIQDAHVLPALIHKCYLAKKNKDLFVIKGSGKPLRQFIFSYDLAKVIKYFLHESDIDHGHYICSPPASAEVSIEYVARKIADIMQYSDAVVFDETYADGQYKKTVVPHAVLKDFDFTEFDNGLRITIQWFLENIERGTVRI
jgi:GDP-L-fucose synthase